MPNWEKTKSMVTKILTKSIKVLLLGTILEGIPREHFQWLTDPVQKLHWNEGDWGLAEAFGIHKVLDQQDAIFAIDIIALLGPKREVFLPQKLKSNCHIDMFVKYWILLSNAGSQITPSQVSPAISVGAHESPDLRS